MATRDEFLARFKAKLDELNADIDELEAQAHQAGAKLRGESERTVIKLREKRDEVEQDMKTLGRSLGDAWHDLREGLDEAGEDLRAAIADAKQRFRQDSQD